MICATCGTANEAGRKFCGECGSALAAACPRCGTSNAPSVKFCGECGLDLRAGGTDVAAAPVSSAAADVASHATERRLVSVLFVDLVGFTTAVRGARRGGHARVPRPLLRRGAHDHRALRRHRREVHRRRGDGRLGRADRARGRRRARGPRRPRPRRRRRRSSTSAARPSARAGVLTGEAAVTSVRSARGSSPATSSTPPRGCSRRRRRVRSYVGEATFRAAAKSITFEAGGRAGAEGQVGARSAIWRATGVASRRGGDGRS